MNKIIKIPLIINKKTGQLSSYINKNQVPEKVWKNNEGTKAKKLIFEFKGVEW